MGGQALGQGSLVGLKLGHYRIADKIGRGGMGEVYRAHDEHLDRDVALKVLPPGTLIDEPDRRHLHKEALILSQLNHPNVATIHDFDTQQGVDFLVMEYISGVTLSKKVAGGPLPEKELVRLGLQLAEGLCAAHEHGVVHCDLKPGNLKLTKDGRLKILDFGLAKLRPPCSGTARTASFSENDVLGGTLLYMAPEQILGGEVDARTDIHAAGLVFYEMATGQRPFAGIERSQLIGAILRTPRPSPTALNPHLSAELERIIGKCLEKEPEDRYQSAKELAVDLRRTVTSTGTQGARRRSHEHLARNSALVSVVTVALLLVGWKLWNYSHPASASAPVVPIVLGDFVNSTGDPAFDETLKQAMTVRLEESPYLSLFSQAKVRETLRLMGRSPSEPLTPELGRDLCQRSAGEALLWGSISKLGNEYVIGLTAINCVTGDEFIHEQLQSASKEQVLRTLDEGTSKLRRRLGESLVSLKKFDTPIEQATTPSLEALKAYSLGRKAYNEKGPSAAIPLYQQAVELDPNFALAWASLSAVQWMDGRADESRSAIKKAFELRDRVSEREKLRVSSYYYKLVLGDVVKSAEQDRLATQNYPSDWWSHYHLAVNLAELGSLEEAVEQAAEGLRLNPSNPNAYLNLSLFEMNIERPDLSEATLKQAVATGISPDAFRGPRYVLAFLRNDAAERDRLAAYGMTNNDTELMSLDSDTKVYFGRIREAEILVRRIIESDRRSSSVPILESATALRDAEVGRSKLARQEVAAALKGSTDWRAQAVAALALASLGETERANAMADGLAKENPSNSYLGVYWLPTIQAAIAVSKGNADQALSSLQGAALHELGQMPPLGIALYPAYVRGKAYLLNHDGVAAASEFQKLIDHRCLMGDAPIAALARVQLARAYVMSGNTAKAQIAYLDFFNLWKDADPNIPILKKAKAEYAKLQ